MVNWGPGTPIHVILPTEPGEIWAELTETAAPDVCPFYFISNKGKLFNKYSGRLLKMAVDSKGYWYYNLPTKLGKHKSYRVHRMIMLTFHYIDGCEDLEIDHINTNKMDFNESNLRWCTHSENGTYSYQNGHVNPKGEDRPIAKITNAQAHRICKAIERGDNMTDIANKEGVSRDTVYSISSHKAWNHISCEYDFTNKNKPNRFKKKS